MLQGIMSIAIYSTQHYAIRVRFILSNRCRQCLTICLIMFFLFPVIIIFYLFPVIIQVIRSNKTTLHILMTCTLFVYNFILSSSKFSSSRQPPRLQPKSLSYVWCMDYSSRHRQCSCCMTRVYSLYHPHTSVLKFQSVQSTLTIKRIT